MGSMVRPELPISDGPWELCGLPGLILYAEDKNKEFIFEATGIEADTDEITPVYVPKCMKRRNVKNYCVPNANTPITLWPPYQAAMGNTISLPEGVHFGIPEKKNGLPENNFIETDYHY